MRGINIQNLQRKGAEIYQKSSVGHIVFLYGSFLFLIKVMRVSFSMLMYYSEYIMR